MVLENIEDLPRVIDATEAKYCSRPGEMLDNLFTHISPITLLAWISKTEDQTTAEFKNLKTNALKLLSSMHDDQVVRVFHEADKAHLNDNIQKPDMAALEKQFQVQDA